jgi:hypothetical protein
MQWGVVRSTDRRTQALHHPGVCRSGEEGALPSRAAAGADWRTSWFRIGPAGAAAGGEGVQEAESLTGAVGGHEQMVVVVAGDDVAADPGAGQRGGDGCCEADIVELGAYLEGDPSGDVVIGQPGAFGVGALMTSVTPSVSATRAATPTSGNCVGSSTTTKTYSPGRGSGVSDASSSSRRLSAPAWSRFSVGTSRTVPVGVLAIVDRTRAWRRASFFGERSGQRPPINDPVRDVDEDRAKDPERPG